MASEIASILLETCELAARAGARELVAWRGRFTAKEKGVTDFVTDADIASQAAVRSVIETWFPQHGFIGEEQPTQNFPPTDDRVYWIVDPLDGTTNYLHGFPVYAVSVAAVCGEELLAGVIFDPNTGNCFRAGHGLGAWCNGTRLSTSSVTRTGDALVAVSLPARVERNSRDLQDFVAATQVCQGVRRSGSAALNLAQLASGTLDAFWASHIHPWDVAAGVLMIREAGGIVSARDGGKFALWSPNFLAAAGAELHQRMLHDLAQAGGA